MISLPSAWKYRLAAIAAIAMVMVLRLVYLAGYCPLDLAPDEAHYWDWSRHLDWSYYSKGPLVAWIIRVSCELFGPWSLTLTGTQMLAVRLPAVVMGGLLVAGLYVLTARVLRDERLALGVVAAALVFPVTAAGSALMTIDAPYTCLWIWAVVIGHEAVFRGTRWAWPVLGLVLGLGILAKYTMILWVPCLGLFLLFSRDHRRLLRGPGFWTMCAIGALCCLPIVYWNARHGWVTLKHTQGHAGLDQAAAIQWLGLPRYLGGQAALLLGFGFVLWLLAVIRYRPWRGDTAANRAEIDYLWWLSVPIFVFFGLFSLKNGGGQPNWPVAAYLAGMVLATGCLVEMWSRAAAAGRRWLVGAGVAFAALALLLTIMVHDTRPFRPVLLRMSGPASPERPMPLRRVDPTCRLRGFRALAARVDTLRTELAAAGHDVVLAGTSWSIPGELGFYCQGHPTVYSVGAALGERHSQYDLWLPNPVANPDAFAGKTFVVVGPDLPRLAQGFARRLHSEQYSHREHDHLIGQWQVSVYEGFRGFEPSSARGF